MLIGYANIDTDKITEYAKEHPGWTNDHWQDYFVLHRQDIPLGGSKRVLSPVSVRGDMETFLGLAAHLASTGQKFEVHMHDGFAAIISYNRLKFVLPAQFVTIEPLTDYTGIPAGQIAAIGQDGGISLPAVPENTQSSLGREAADVEAKLSLLEKEAKAVEDCTSSDMKDLKEQLDSLMEKIHARQEELMEKLQKKQAELAAKEKALKRELFILETQIYGIRCYLGEVVSFYTVRGGKPAPKDLPVIIYQKIRYLDEELGKYLSLYEFGNHEHDPEQLLNILKSRDDIADLVCPGPKSMSAIRISRTGTVKKASDEVANILRDYELYHDNQLAVMIRNGEQIHISWLDPEYISVSDDNLFYRPGETDSQAYDEHDIFEKSRVESEASKARNEMISRWFFFSVLQGVVDNTGLISLPEKTKITDMASPYIKFSTAEGWVADNRYGSFKEMLEKSASIPLRAGDAVLTGMRIVRNDYLKNTSGEAWRNNRGIGEKNRTAGASLPKRKVLPISKVIPRLVVKYSVQVCRAYIKMIPDGETWYEYDGGNTRTTYPMKDRDDAVIVKKPDYELVCTDETVREEEETTKTIRCEDWLYYAGKNGSNSYRSLSDKQLVALSGIRRKDVFYTDSEGKENGQDCYNCHKMKDAYELQEKGVQLLCRKVVRAEIIGETDHHYYCITQNWGINGEYNVNFRIFDSEMIPLTFLCSTWVSSVIASGNVGNYRLCGDSMNYADMLPYLNITLTHLREREKEEKALLEKAGGGTWLKNTPGWDAVLCEWKIRNRYHALTAARAGKFIKEINAGTCP